MLIGRPEGSAESAARRDDQIDPRLVFRAVPGQSREQIIRELSQRLAAEGVVSDSGELAARLLDREKLGCTGLGAGVAIPHCKLAEIDRVAVAVASTAAPVDFGASDGKPVDLIFLVISPANGAAVHLQALARVSRLLRVPGVAQGLREAATQEGLVTVIREAEAGRAVAQ